MFWDTSGAVLAKVTASSGDLIMALPTSRNLSPIPGTLFKGLVGVNCRALAAVSCCVSCTPFKAPDSTMALPNTLNISGSIPPR